MAIYLVLHMSLLYAVVVLIPLCVQPYSSLNSPMMNVLLAITYQFKITYLEVKQIQESHNNRV